MIPPSTLLDATRPELRDRLSETPNAAGIYLLTPLQGLPYLGSTGYLQKRLTRLLTSNDSNSGSNPRNTWTKVEYWRTGSRLERALMLYWVARREFRTTYQQRLKLRSAWFLSILPGSGFARLAVRNRLSKSALRSFGPFSSREAAERTMQAVLGLFQIRYCHDVLVPDPSHPGCIFGEMNQCMRPCQMAVTRDEYAGEVQRLTEFLEGKGKQTLATLKASRDRASDDTDFEEAARLHKELERVKQVAGTRDDLVTDVNSLTGVAITRGIEEGDVVLWPITAGYWQPRLTLNFRSDGPAVRSLDQILREQMSAHLSVVRDHGKRSEEIALLSRWYYSTWRDGSWLAFSRLEDVNYRKLVREVSSLLRAPVR